MNEAVTRPQSIQCRMLESLMKGDSEAKSKKTQRSRNFMSRDSENIQQTCRSVVFPAKTAKSYEALEVCATLS